jgi:uncharacterized phage protein (TIGR01671 family)
MQREIKFRAWSKEENRMITDANEGVRIYLNGTVADEKGWATSHLIVMAWTGLKDKNGKEIYEGDIVRRFVEDYRNGKEISKEQVFEIMWNNEFAEFQPIVRESGWTPVLKYILDDGAEIIGNIHESPELLTETKRT